jgi:hypothetical protein
MRRACATLILALFSFLLAAPALFADADSNLPACCRRLGLHRCALVATMAGPASGPSVQAAPCSTFLGARAVPVQARAGVHKAPQGAVSSLAAYATEREQTEARYRVSFNRSRQKRGPPALFS